MNELLQAIQQGRNSRHDPLHQLQEVALTTNGTLLDASRAQQLQHAGLDRITISLDGATGASVSRMAGLQGGDRHGEQVLQRVLQGIAAAKAAGFQAESGAIKLNSVIQRGHNDDQLLPLAQLARQQNVELRLIEYMDVGNRNGWSAAEVVTASELLSQLQQRWPMEPLGRPQHGTASRWRYRDGAGHVARWPRLANPSAATATACGSPLKAWPTPACLLSKAMICAHSSQQTAALTNSSRSEGHLAAAH